MWRNTSARLKSLEGKKEKRKAENGRFFAFPAEKLNASGVDLHCIPDKVLAPKYRKLVLSIISKNYYAKIILSCSVKLKMLGKIRDPFI